MSNNFSLETKLSIFFLILLVVLGILNVIFEFLPAPRFLLFFTFFSSTAISAFFGFYYSKKVGLSNFVGKALLLLGIYFSLSMSAYVAWDIYSILGIQTPYPSIADLFWLMGVPFLITSLCLLLKIYSPRINSQMIFQSLMLFVLISGATVYYLGVPALSETNLLARTFDLIFIITDAIFLVMIITIVRVSGGRIYKGLFLFVIGLALILIGDLFFVIRNSAGNFSSGDISDVILFLGWLVNAAAIYYTAKIFIDSKQMEK